MFRLLCILAVALAGLAATPTPAPKIRHYTHEQWQAIYAKFTARPRPEYPSRLRVARLTGSGMFRMYIDTQGKVRSIKILQSTGHPELDGEAIKALSRWHGKPGPKWDLDMPITFTMTIR